jgi:hypothetical protein
LIFTVIKEYLRYITKFLNSEEKPANDNDPLIYEEKRYIFKYISNVIKRKITSIKRIIYSGKAQFGNTLLIINKLIFICEIIKCNEITLAGKQFWFIKDNIVLDGYNITINKVSNITIQRHEINSETIFYNSLNIFFYYFKIKQKIRIHLLKNEIMNNLPFLNISKNDLYIYIRSGDIFKDVIHRPYAQPPFCFYKSIFDNFNFSSIYIIAQNKNNPTINKLIGKYKNIIYKQNNLKYDISSLINCYNIVGSVSSFLNTIIMLNSNLQNYFEYNLYQMYQKIVQYHYDLFEFPQSFTVYRMEPSTNYKENMKKWKNNKRQKILMIKEKCVNTFKIRRVRHS